MSWRGFIRSYHQPSALLPTGVISTEQQTGELDKEEQVVLPANVIDASAAFAARQEAVQRQREAWYRKGAVALAAGSIVIFIAAKHADGEQSPPAEQPPATVIIEAQTCALDAATLDTTEGQAIIEYPPGTFCTASGVLVVPVEPNYTG